MRIDINADLGEGYGRYTCGDDDALLAIVTSANVACGFHAGDPEIMAHTFEVAKQHGVAVGAHCGFPDLWGFGRRPIPFSAGEIERLVTYQIGAAQALASYAGHRITHVNAHGTLANLAEFSVKSEPFEIDSDLDGMQRVQLRRHGGFGRCVRPGGPAIGRRRRSVHDREGTHGREGIHGVDHIGTCVGFIGRFNDDAAAGCHRRP